MTYKRTRAPLTDAIENKADWAMYVACHTHATMLLQPSVHAFGTTRFHALQAPRRGEPKPARFPQIFFPDMVVPHGEKQHVTNVCEAIPRLRRLHLLRHTVHHGL